VATASHHAKTNQNHHQHLSLGVHRLYLIETLIRKLCGFYLEINTIGRPGNCIFQQYPMQKMAIYEDSDEVSEIRQCRRSYCWTSTGDSSPDESSEDSKEDLKR
jgi:hypothetical protein